MSSQHVSERRSSIFKSFYSLVSRSESCGKDGGRVELFFEHLSAQIDKKILVLLPVKEEGRVYKTRGTTLVDAVRPLG